jgi:hypothetical protein
LGAMRKSTDRFTCIHSGVSVWQPRFLIC